MLPALAVAFGAQAAQGILAGAQRREEVKAQNKLTAQQNRTNATEAAYTIANVQIQQAAVRRQAAGDLNTAQRMAMIATGDSTAQAAAAGVKGASVDAVQQDVGIELDRATGEIQSSAITQEANLNDQIRSIAVQTRLNFGTFSEAPGWKGIIGQAAVSGAMSAGTSYAQNYFKFGASTAAPRT